MCKKYFDKSKTEVYSVYYDDAPHSFCCKTCMNVYILANRKIVPCNWCKVRADVILCEQIDKYSNTWILYSLNIFSPVLYVFLSVLPKLPEQQRYVFWNGCVCCHFSTTVYSENRASIGLLVFLRTFGWKSRKIFIFCYNLLFLLNAFSDPLGIHICIHLYL